MNNKKKLLSIITALAITASAFTGFAVTAIAENTDEQTISADSEITLADETTSTEAVTEDEQSEAVELAIVSFCYSCNLSLSLLILYGTPPYNIT